MWTDTPQAPGEGRRRPSAVEARWCSGYDIDLGLIFSWSLSKCGSLGTFTRSPRYPLSPEVTEKVQAGVAMPAGWSQEKLAVPQEGPQGTGDASSLPSPKSVCSRDWVTLCFSPPWVLPQTAGQSLDHAEGLVGLRKLKVKDAGLLAPGGP